VATFGRHLLDRGVVSRAQLEEATQVMVVFGGRLGTILVEAGVLTLEQVEEQLARHLDLRRPPARDGIDGTVARVVGGDPARRDRRARRAAPLRRQRAKRARAELPRRARCAL
jgi:hypothetical protein